MKYIKKQKGFTLIELLVSISIITILVSVTIPIAETSKKRSNEYELKNNLRVIRLAIDNFKDDFESISPDDRNGANDPFKEIRKSRITGYPKSLLELQKFKYLRKVPQDPMTKPDYSNDNGNWGTLSSTDQENERTNGEDLYDIFSKSEEKAFYQSKYKTW